MVNKKPKILVQWRDDQGEMEEKFFSSRAEADFFAKNNLPRMRATQIKVHVYNASYNNGRMKAENGRMYDMQDYLYTWEGIGGRKGNETDRREIKVRASSTDEAASKADVVGRTWARNGGFKRWMVKIKNAAYSNGRMKAQNAISQKMKKVGIENATTHENTSAAQDTGYRAAVSDVSY